jgi:hypothetical protein
MVIDATERSIARNELVGRALRRHEVDWYDRGDTRVRACRHDRVERRANQRGAYLMMANNREFEILDPRPRRHQEGANA